MESDSLNESWIELTFTGEGASMHASMEDTDMARLLKEAQDGSQRGSRVGSGANSQASPPSPQLSGGGEDGTRVAGPEIVSDLSSRPEIAVAFPSSLRHPYARGYSLRNSEFIKGKSAWVLDNLPILIVSHACSFLLGAATFAVFFKKYTRYVAVN